MNFASDNWAGVSAPIMAAIDAANSGAAPAYGADDWTAAAGAALTAAFGHDLAMSAVPTGTAANALAIEIGCGPDGLLVCHDEAHSISAEAASRPLFNPGVGIVGLKGVGGKIDPETLARALEGRAAGRKTLVSLTNATEAGLVYRPAEIAALAAIARRAGAMLHIDGARFANAVAATGASAADLSWRSGVDLVSFGATKNGALAAEAVIAFDPSLAGRMAERRKAMGYTFSKGRFIACQLAAYVKDGHWLDLAGRANAAAARLAAGFAGLGVELAWPREANEAFPILRKDVAAALRKAGARCHDWSLLGNLRPERPLRANEGVVRFVASFATTDAEADAVLHTLAETLGARAHAHSA